MSARALPLAALLAALLLAPLASAAWSMEDADARRSGTVSAPIPTADVRQVWNASGQYVAALVLPDGAVVGIGDPVTVWSKDGAQRWSTRTVGPQSQVFVARGGAVLSNGTIVAAGSLPFGAPAIVGYDPADGKQIIFDRTFPERTTCDSIEENAIVVAPDDSFYVGGCGPGILAYHKNGTKKWSFTGEAERVALGATHLYAEVEDLELANGTTYEDALLALSLADGSIAWATKLDDGGGDPIVAQDGTIVLNDGGRIRGFAPADGAPEWATIVPRPYGLAIAPNGTIAAGSTNGVAWLSPTDGTMIGASRSVDGRGLLVGANVHLRISGANVIAVDTTGTELWRVNGTARNFQVNLAVADDGSLYIPEEGQMRAYRGEGGSAAPTPGATPPATGAPASAATPPATAAGEGEAEGEGDGDKGTPGPGALLLVVALAATALLARRRSG